LKGLSPLPEAWRERFRADFGIVPETGADGVLQDVHWFDGYVGGAFQGYALGNLMSAQFFEAARAAHPELAREIEAGKFDTLRGWLADHVHRHGRTYPLPISTTYERSSASSTRSG